MYDKLLSFINIKFDSKLDMVIRSLSDGDCSSMHAFDMIQDRYYELLMVIDFVNSADLISSSELDFFQDFLADLLQSARETLVSIPARLV